ncbi:MAG: GNAT family N-acetyltransferase [bacterium]|nr:GNAT family N-acetyltransferase [bacterium]
MNFTLRKVMIGDSDFLFNLRNEESVRRVSFNQESINPMGHSEWFKKKLADSQSQIFIAEVKSQSIGMVRFDLIGDADAEVNVAVTEKFQGKGYGSGILRQSAVKFLELFPKINSIHAFIKPDNLVSIRSFIKAGYALQGEVEHPRILLILTR